jgi:LPS sulfotransferase NodH
MKTLLDKPIIIVGAARSGTHMLAKALEMNLDVYYLGECNELWKKHLPFSKYDTVAPSSITEKVVETTRKDFFKLASTKNKKRWMEKTPANTLRMSFVTAVLPQAKYIHIIRDGRDVAISAARKCQGDILKISREPRQDRLTFTERNEQFFRQAKEKISKGLDLKQLARDPQRYLDSWLRMAGLKKKSIWGPRFPGYEYYFEKYSLLEFTAIQWRESVEATLNYFSANPHFDLMEIKYEELLFNPAETLAKLLNFIEPKKWSPKKVKHSIKSDLTKFNWKNILNEEQLKLISSHIEKTLNYLGYPPTFNH